MLFSFRGERGSGISTKDHEPKPCDRPLLFVDRRKGEDPAGFRTFGGLCAADCKMPVWKEECAGAAEAFGKGKDRSAGNCSEGGSGTGVGGVKRGEREAGNRMIWN